jgi:hypothetical protein
MQVPKLHAVPNWQLEQAAPSWPQALLLLPVWQSPFASQHPVAHEDGVQTLGPPHAGTTAVTRPMAKPSTTGRTFIASPYRAGNVFQLRWCRQNGADV